MEMLKEKPNLDHLRISLESISPWAKEIFIQFVKGSVEFIRKNDLACDNNFGYGCFQTNLLKTCRGTKVINPKIYIVEDDFKEEEKSSIEPIKHHEAVELYEMSKGRFFPDDIIEDDNGVESQKCHQAALIEEFYYAFQQGIANEHLKFILSKSENYFEGPDLDQYIHENNNAYNIARRRYQKNRNR